MGVLLNLPLQSEWELQFAMKLIKKILLGGFDLSLVYPAGIKLQLDFLFF